MLNKIEIQDVIKLSHLAGKAIMEVYRQDFNVEFKADNFPLTQADKAAHHIVLSGLKALDEKNKTDIPVMSEEGKSIPYEERKHWEYYWLIDPVDGTKEFIKKNNEFTVNIALIHQERPVLGVVFAPALNITYWAKQGEGAYKDGEKLPLQTFERRDTYKIVASRSHLSDETQKFISNIKTPKEKQLISIGSSLKICLVAEGEADIYPRLGPTMEWDTAAAHAVVREAGMQIRVYKKELMSMELTYNKKNLLNPFFVIIN